MNGLRLLWYCRRRARVVRDSAEVQGMQRSVRGMRRVMSLLVVVLVVGLGVGRAEEPSKAPRLHGSLGVTVSAVGGLADVLGLANGEGAIVDRIDKDSPAEKAEIQAGDVITKVGDQLIFSQEQLSRLIGHMAPGSEVRIEFVREKGKTSVATVKLGESKAAPAQVGGQEPKPAGLRSLGVTVSAAPEGVADVFGLANGEGVIVARVGKDSLAEKAGIQVGDMITKVRDQLIFSPDQLSRLIGHMAPGNEVQVEYIHEKGKTAVATVKLGNEPRGSGVQFLARVIEQPAAPKVCAPLGVSLAAITPARAAELGLAAGQGVVIASVSEASPAEKAGIKANDVVTKLGDAAITSAEQLAKLVGDMAAGNEVKMELVREKGKTETVTVKLGEKPEPKPEK